MIAAPRRLGMLVALAIYCVDQAVKYVIIGPLALRDVLHIPLLPFFDLSWVENYGVSMGFLTASSNAMRWALVGLTLLISLAVLAWMWREKSRADVLALGLVLGGALGNITDRVRFGFVVDYADLHFGTWRPFLVFNVGDAAITIGVVILLVRALLVRDGKNIAEKTNA